MLFDSIIIYLVSYFSLFVGIFFLYTFFENRAKMKGPKIKKFPKISILIPAYNAEKFIKKTIECALNCDYPEKEIIVIDDGSTDRTYQIVKKFKNKGVKIFKKENGGKASALNFGIDKCNGKLIMTLDADSFLEKDTIRKMVAYFKDRNVMSVVPTLKVYNPKTIIERMQVIEYTLTSFIRKIFTFMHGLNVNPCAPIYRAEFLKKNKFDEDNLTEDLEMGLRVQSQHYDIQHAIDANVYTIVPNNLKSLMKQRVRWNYGTIWNLKNKYGFMFSLKYGDLGLFILPTTLIFFGLAVFLLIYYVGRLLWNVIYNIYFLSLIGFDMKYALFGGGTTQIMNYLIDMKMFLFLSLFIIGGTICLLAKRTLNEKRFRFSYFIYISLYSIFLGIFPLIAILYMIFRKKPKW